MKRFRELGAQLRLGLCLTDMAIAIPPTEPQAAAAAAEAREIWTDLESPPMLTRLEQGLARWASESPEKGTATISEGVESPTRGS